MPIRIGPDQYPKTPREETVEEWFGREISDPYRWLESDDDPDVKDWEEKQTRLTRYKLDQTGYIDDLKPELRDLHHYTQYSVPVKKGNRYFYTRRAPDREQHVLYMREKRDGEPVKLLDPVEKYDENTALTTFVPSDSGKMVAYSISRDGSDWQTIRILSVSTGEHFSDHLKFTRFPGITWEEDGSAFYYSRYPDPADFDDPSELYQQVYHHELGAPQRENTLVYERPDDPVATLLTDRTEDGSHVLISVGRGTDPERGYLIKKRGSRDDFSTLIEPGLAEFWFVGKRNGSFYFRTDHEAPMGRVVRVPEDGGLEDLEEVLPERDDPLVAVDRTGDQFITAYLEDACHKLYMVSPEEPANRTELDVPEMSSLTGEHGPGDMISTGNAGDDELIYGVTSFDSAPSIHSVDLESGRERPFLTPEQPLEDQDLTVQRFFADSDDGTRVPLFLFHRQDLDMNKTHPVLLYGYGGFRISLTPQYAPAAAQWVREGGIYARACLRGGGEYGKEWHFAGRRENKENVFDDFSACARYLIEQNYTTPEQMAAVGGSNGGLLVAACMLRDPDLFGAVVSEVPVLDLLRYHRWTIGRYWIPEYGHPEESEETFEQLLSYSPYHNIEDDVTYPPILTRTARSDDRVVPAHARKFVARLQEAASGEEPKLLKIESQTGHGHGKSRKKQIKEEADRLAFLLDQLE